MSFGINITKYLNAFIMLRLILGPVRTKLLFLCLEKEKKFKGPNYKVSGE
jgi:hypothetical protein